MANSARFVNEDDQIIMPCVVKIESRWHNHSELVAVKPYEEVDVVPKVYDSGVWCHIVQDSENPSQWYLDPENPDNPRHPINDVHHDED